MSDIITSCIFCDDIRQELSGKVSLIGVYTNDLVIHEELPVNLQKLHIYCSLSGFDKRKNYKIIIQQTGAEDRESSVPEEAVKSDTASVLIFEISPLYIEKEGSINVLLDDGKKRYDMGSINISQDKK